MNSLLSLILFSSLVTSVGSANADPSKLKNFSAEYHGYKGPIKVAISNLSLQGDKTSFTYSSRSRTVGIVAELSGDVITEVSKGILENNKIKVNEYSYRHKKDKKVKKFKRIRFDWANKTANTRSHKNPKVIAVKITDGTVDRFTLRLAIMSDMLATGKVAEHTIIDIGKLKTYHFQVLGKRKIKTPAGTFDTILLKKSRKNKKRVTLMWCAPKLNFLPVKIQHIEKNGSKLSLLLSKVSGL